MRCLYETLLIHHLEVRAAGCAKDVPCCENKRVKKNKDSMWRVQEDMFSRETYGCTSWSPYIVAVISGFILAWLPFVSHFYWIAPQLPLHPHVYFCHFVLLQLREISPHLIWCYYSHRHTLSLTQFKHRRNS